MNEVVEALVNVFPLIVPEGVLVLAACVLFLGATFWTNRSLWAVVALVSLAAAGIALWYSPTSPAGGAALFAAPVRIDALALFIKAVAILGGAVLVLFSWDEVPDRVAAEYHACLLVIVAGVCLTGSANELVMLFLALELISIPTYIMLYLPKSDGPAQEAAMKYFLLSVFSSGLLLFGFSYLYGLSGTTNLPAMTEALGRAGPGGLPAIVQVALVTVVAGLSFKITAVPFHFYAPDVYQGTSTSNAALLAFVPKVAGFAALLRVLGYVMLPDAAAVDMRPGLSLGSQVPMLLWILAAVTMTLGNILALLQDNVKRMLAYSSVAHAGYMLIGLTVAPHLSGTATGGVDAVLFYLVAYGGMTIGAFAVIAYLSTPQRPADTVHDFDGLSTTHPDVALLMLVFMLSLIGIPLTAGFAGKFLLFWGAMGVASEGADPTLAEQAMLYRSLALIGAVNAAIGGWYYLRIITVMYLRNPVKPLETVRRWPGLATIWACAAVTILFGVYPKALLRSTETAVHAPAQQAQVEQPEALQASHALPSMPPEK